MSEAAVGGPGFANFNGHLYVAFENLAIPSFHFITERKVH